MRSSFKHLTQNKTNYQQESQQDRNESSWGLAEPLLLLFLWSFNLSLLGRPRQAACTRFCSVNDIIEIYVRPTSKSPPSDTVLISYLYNENIVRARLYNSSITETQTLGCPVNSTKLKCLCLGSKCNKTLTIDHGCRGGGGAVVISLVYRHCGEAEWRFIEAAALGLWGACGRMVIDPSVTIEARSRQITTKQTILVILPYITRLL